MTTRLETLARSARALGGLPWVQGPGGNVSVKVGAQLHVKASGTRLENLGRPGTLASVPLDVAEKALAGDLEAADALFDRSPRPSLETWFHALPGRYILHTHPIGVLLLACTGAPLPPGIAEVPPALPGRDVALAMRAAGDVSAWILRNHGLCVRANSAAEAVAQSRAIAQNCASILGIPERDFPTVAPWTPIAVEGGWMTGLPKNAKPDRGERYLFPDAAVLASRRAVPACTATHAIHQLATDPRPCVLVDPHGQRAALARTPNQLQDVVEVATVHDWLLSTLGSAAVPLPDAMVRAILDQPAEKFRQAGRVP